MNEINMSTVTNYMLGLSQVINIYYGQTKVWPLTHDYSRDYLTFVPLEPCEFKFTGTSYTGNLYYSDDNGSTWNQLANDTYTPTVNTGNKILFKATSWAAGLSGPGSFVSTGQYNVEGNILSLANGDNFASRSLYIPSQYANLFANSDVVDASNLYLPAPTQNGCYMSLFHSCSYLTTPPELPYTSLSNFCYSNMFTNCTSLEIAPELPAITMRSECYRGMFTGCTSLTTAPELPATILAEECYMYMFAGCTSLNYIKCLATDISANYCTDNWVDGVAQSGIFVKAPSMSSWTTGIDGIPTSWIVQNATPDHNYLQDYLTFEALESGTFTWTDTQNNNSIYYSTDNGSTWTTLASGSSTPTIAANSKVLFKASGLTIDQYHGIGTFSATGNFNAVGNIMSLIYGDNFDNQTDLTGKNKVFSNLFYENIKLISAENLKLPATTLSNVCYSDMFDGCTSLTIAPSLPATTLASGCYMSMFFGCSSLVIAPSLPATTLVSNCYSYMFDGCTSLIVAPALPATTLAEACYLQMFMGCTSLNYIKCLATNISATDCTTNWVNGVAASGTFTRNSNNTDWTIGNNGIPSGWTVQNAS